MDVHPGEDRGGQLAETVLEPVLSPEPAPPAAVEAIEAVAALVETPVPPKPRRGGRTRAARTGETASESAASGEPAPPPAPSPKVPRQRRPASSATVVVPAPGPEINVLTAPPSELETEFPVPTSPVTTKHPELGPDEQARLQDLQKRVGVTFRRPALLREAMTHASWNNERGEQSGPGHDNERLEYLGDAVLELIVGEYLFKRFPGYDEGQLTQLRAALVNTVSLARLAERLGLGDALLLGRGAAKTGARHLPSLLANSFEALIGAIFLDQGYRVATRVFLQSIGDLADWTDENHKGKLQELAQERLGATPSYRVVPAGGPGHRREYRAEAVVAGKVLGEGRGGTKQAAEQAAARVALEGLSKAPTGVAASAAGAARQAAAGAATESARVRRRVAEVAADRGAAAAGRQRRPQPQSEPAAQPDNGVQRPRRGIFGVLRAAAEVLVGRKPEPEPEPTPEPKKRTRRGRRGGRGRSRPAAQKTPPP